MTLRILDRLICFQNKDKDMKYYLLSFETIPGGAMFEAAVKKSDDSGYEVSGQIGRTNLYGNQSSCTSVIQLKKFCFCKQQSMKTSHHIINTASPT